MYLESAELKDFRQLYWRFLRAVECSHYASDDWPVLWPTVGKHDQQQMEICSRSVSQVGVWDDLDWPMALTR